MIRKRLSADESKVIVTFEIPGSVWADRIHLVGDLNDWDQSLASIVPGQSGMIGSPHYDDQMGNWLGVGYHPLYYSRSRVESEAAHLLTLNP